MGVKILRVPSAAGRPRTVFLDPVRSSLGDTDPKDPTTFLELTNDRNVTSSLSLALVANLDPNNNDVSKV